MSTLQKAILKSKLPPIGPLSTRGVQRAIPGRKRDYTPIPWSQYFETCEDVIINGGDQFRVYSSGNTGPVLVLLHGGGFSALTWALFTVSVTSMVECRVLAIDLRGHGDTVTSNDEDLSAETMSSDIGEVIKSLYGPEPPPVILIGHSMGGAIAVHTAHGGHIPSLIGLAVIDVVEGTAMDALASMQTFLRSRPTYFKSLEHAIEWCVRSGQVRNVDSAKVSMPGQIKNCETGKLATNELATYKPDTEPIASPHIYSNQVIMEEEVSSTTANASGNTVHTFKPPLPPTDDLHKYSWRIDLGRTEKYWSGWFQGLSNTFLECPIPKMLLLAGIDRLDKDLTVGQMQGKFQMHVLPACGHAVHEDVPDKVAEVLATFMVRHKVAEPAADFVRSFPAC